MNLNEVKYKWATSLFDTMLQNFWIPEKVDLSNDAICINDLTAHELNGYKGILSYLTFLDSIQTTTLPKLAELFTAPEIRMAIAKQTEQESIHNKSYQVLIETLIGKEDRNQVYDLWREIPELRHRCEIIAELYQKFDDTKSQEDYFIALYADYLLESIYFLSGFYFFYNLTSRGLMQGSADMIRYINRDENTHIAIFQQIMIEAQKIFPHSQEQMYEIIDKTVEQECVLCYALFQDEILGISQETTKNFLRLLADKRLKSIGLKPLYNATKNPYEHLDRLANLDSKANFFESTVTNYKMSHTVDNWDF